MPKKNDEVVQKFERKKYNAKAKTTCPNFWNNLRASKNITHKEIAKKLDIKPQTSQQYFLGYTLPTPEKIKILCDWFDVDLAKGTREFKKIYKAWGAAHPTYIDCAGQWRSPVALENNKRRKRKNPLPPLPRKEMTYKAWSKIDNFWAKQRAAHDATYEELADIFGRNHLTIRAYFTGFQMPPYSIVEYLCKMWDIDFEKGYAEFQKANEKWGKAHPNYVKYGNTWVTKNYLKNQRARNNVRHLRNGSPNAHNARNYWALTDKYKLFCKYVYGKLSYEDYCLIEKMTSYDECLEFIKGKVSDAVYRKCSKIKP